MRNVHELGLRLIHCNASENIVTSRKREGVVPIFINLV